jgi:hypothetical protein
MLQGWGESTPVTAASPFVEPSFHCVFTITVIWPELVMCSFS